MITSLLPRPHFAGLDEIGTSPVLGGPALVAMFFTLIWWMCTRAVRKNFQMLGLFLGAVFFISSLTNAIFMQVTVLYLPFFLLGVYADSREVTTTVLSAQL